MKKLLVLLCTLLLVGCKISRVETSNSHGDNIVFGPEFNLSTGEATLVELRLSDGTPCVMLLGYSKTAISCGWTADVPARYRHN